MIQGNGWKLIDVTDRIWEQDNSGLYTVINYTKEETIRIDVMNVTHAPIVTLNGETASAVFKGLADYLKAIKAEISTEHAMYIGSELARCELLRLDFVQD